MGRFRFGCVPLLAVLLLLAHFHAGAALIEDPAWTAGEQVVVAAGDSVLVSQSTPRLASLVVEGSLVCSNWETQVSADLIEVRSGGKITVAGVSSETLTNRVWIACGDLTVASGGCIDVEGLGWGRAANGLYGCGPGAYLLHAGRGGAAHGGHGAFMYYIESSATFPGLCYDDPCAPTLPGSGGSNGDNWGSATFGGGAVRIEASGTVRVDGTIYASAGKSGTRNAIAKRGTAGSGGSVWITCRDVAGSGSILADGGSCDTLKKRLYGQSYEKSAPGGGGMIAIAYDPAHQTADAVEGLTVSANRGLYTADPDGEFPDLSGETHHRQNADIGTVWLTDDKLLPALIGKSLTGALVNSDYAVEGNLDFAGGHVRFAKSGAEVSVGGNLNVAAGAQLEIGGSTNRYVHVQDSFLRGGDSPVRLAVAGSLTVAEGGRLDVRGSVTNGTGQAGAVVEVGRAMTIAAGGLVQTWSEPVNMGSPEFVVGSLHVAEGGTFSAFGGGGVYGNGTWTEQFATGPGYGRISGTGGGHGGEGGFRNSGYGAAHPDRMGGAAYGDEWRPDLPGSGGGSNGPRGGCGGGVVRVKARGTVRIDGWVCADGESDLPLELDNSQAFSAGGSGGSVLIDCREFLGNATGRISADGGSAFKLAYGRSSGAGGRIAIWQCGQEYSPALGPRFVTRSETQPEAIVFAGTVSAAGGALPEGTIAMNGADLTREEYEAMSKGGDGTVRWGVIKARKGFVMAIR